MEEYFFKTHFPLKILSVLPIVVLFHSTENKDLSRNMIMAGRKISEVKMHWTNKLIKMQVSLSFLQLIWAQWSLLGKGYYSTMHSTRACLSATASTRACLRFAGCSFRQTAAVIQNPAWVEPCCQGRSCIGPATPHLSWTLKKSIDYTTLSWRSAALF